MKKIYICILSCVLLFATGCLGDSQRITTLERNQNTLQSEIEALNDKINILEAENEELKNKNEELKAELNSIAEGVVDTVKEEVRDFFDKFIATIFELINKNDDPEPTILPQDYEPVEPALY